MLDEWRHIEGLLTAMRNDRWEKDVIAKPRCRLTPELRNKLDKLERELREFLAASQR
jgi:hypothetical protein